MRTATALLALFVAASADAAGSRVLGSAEADGKAPVAAVLPGRATDLVVVEGGYDRGFRPGSVCTVSRDGKAFGSVVIADATRERAVALILSLDSGTGITAGDLVSPRANPRI